MFLIVVVEYWEVSNLTFFIAWFLFQLGYALLSLYDNEPAHVAWWAHVGGFLTGALIAFLIKNPSDSI